MKYYVQASERKLRHNNYSNMGEAIDIANKLSYTNVFVFVTDSCGVVRFAKINTQKVPSDCVAFYMNDFLQKRIWHKNEQDVKK